MSPIVMPAWDIIISMVNTIMEPTEYIFKCTYKEEEQIIVDFIAVLPGQDLTEYSNIAITCKDYLRGNILREFALPQESWSSVEEIIENLKNSPKTSYWEQNTTSIGKTETPMDSLFVISEASLESSNQELPSKIELEDSSNVSIILEVCKTEEIIGKISVDTAYSIPGEKIGELLNTAADKPLNESGYFEFKEGNISETGSSKPSVNLENLKLDINYKFDNKY